MSVFAVACRAAGLPEPEPEYQFHPRRKWRFDFAWPDRGIALEIDGGTWISGRHNRGSGFLRDMEKLREAAILGWRVLRCTPKEFENGVGLELVLRAVEESKK